MYLLEIDHGTGGAKATIIDAEGTVRSYAFEEYPILTPRPDWSEHDPRRYWEIACRLIRKAVRDADIDPKAIQGVAASSR